MELIKQDEYDYHDCNQYARSIDIFKDKEKWQKMMNKENDYKELAEVDLNRIL